MESKKEENKMLELLMKSEASLSQVLLEGIKRSQERKGNLDGVFLVEIIAETEKEIQELAKKGVPDLAVLGVIALLTVKDMMYMNKDGNKYSLLPLDGYAKFGEIVKENMGGLEWGFEERHLLQGSAETISFSELKKILLNNDQNALVENRNEFERKLKIHKELFLDGSEDIPRVILASLQRSGNSMARRLFEQTSGIVTGADMIPIIAGATQLIVRGFKGERVTNNRTWISKTHHPYNTPVSEAQQGSCFILLVRNPLDTIISYLLLSVTQTHDLQIENNFQEEFPKEWEYMVKYMSNIWNKFNNYYIELAQKREVPVLFIRYEDFVSDKEKHLKDAYSFIFGVDNIDGTYLEQRIKSAVNSEASGSVYKLKAGGIQKNLSKFKESHLNYIKRMCKDNILFFGYQQIEGQENPTGLFQYDQLTESEMTSINGFDALNKEMRAWYKQDKESLDKIQYKVSEQGTGIQVKLPEEPQVKFRHLIPKIKIQKA